MEEDKRSNQKSDIYLHWMAAHARLKNEFTEDEKCHNLMSWLIFLLTEQATKKRMELIKLTAMAVIQDLKNKGDNAFKDMNDWLGARYLKEMERYILHTGFFCDFFISQKFSLVLWYSFLNLTGGKF